MFITLTSPYNALTPRGVAKCLSESIKEAGLGDEFTPQSFRPSAPSAAIFSGCDPDLTRQIGRWKTPEVFYEHYVYPMSKGDFTDKIFQSNIQTNGFYISKILNVLSCVS